MLWNSLPSEAKKASLLCQFKRSMSTIPETIMCVKIVLVCKYNTPHLKINKLYLQLCCVWPA